MHPNPKAADGRHSTRRFRRGPDPRLGRGFTLIEVLVVISIIAILAALLFPAFAMARRSSQRAACISNLRQLGAAIYLYADDSDDGYPWGADPADLNTNIWGGTPYAATVKTMPHLQDVLDPYVRSKNVWGCPADAGFDTLDLVPTGFPTVPLHARPTCFQAFGTSYFYRTEIALLHKSISNLTAHDAGGAPGQHGPADINVLMDGNGSWHGSPISGRRYNAVMGDGHAVNSDVSDFFHTWSLTIDHN